MSQPHFHDLEALMAQLRGEQGCPWVCEQTLNSLRSHIIEESHEVVEAIQEGNATHLCSETGDLLLQVLFIAQVAKEQGLFDMAQVMKQLAEKLKRRHPHVFQQPQSLSLEELSLQWKRIKKEEAVLAGEPLEEAHLQSSKALPPLSYALAISEEAASYGFDWPDWQMASEKIEEELAEVREAARADDFDHLEDELGDLLFAAASLCRKLKVDPEVALLRACQKFRGRFELMMAPLSRNDLPSTIEQWEEAWKAAKKRHPGKSQSDKSPALAASALDKLPCPLHKEETHD